jgi:hypothetical protein
LLISAGRRVGSLTLEPPRDGRDDVRLFGGRELASPLYAVPLCETTSATGRRRMLRYEDRMSPERCLLPVVRGRWWCKPLGDERRRVLENHRPALCHQVRPLLGAKRKPPPERRSRQRIEELIQIPQSTTG